MNLLLDKLPKEHEGIKIDTNFRNFILFELLMQDNEIGIDEKVRITLDLFFDNEVEDIEKAINCILWFYKCGKEEKKTTSNTTNKKNKQIYSFEYDDEYIYSAFLQQYNINLNSIKYLHWWEFKALFQCLGEDCLFVQIMSYRAIDLSKIKDKSEKDRYRKLQKTYALPDMRTEEQKERDFGNAFW